MKIVALLGVVAIVSATAYAEFRVGAAAAVINPPEKMPLAGYYSLRLADGVLDDIFSKAIVFEENGERAAIVVCDLITLPRHTVQAARELILKESGIAATRVMIAATHSHTGPALARESTRDDFDGGNSELGVQYTRELPKLIAKSVADAVQQLAPARLMVAKTQVENLAFNRRFWMQDGTVGWNPPKLSPQIVAPAGPHDPEIGILHAASAEKDPRPLAVLVNYAMHPDTTGGTRISADFPGILAQHLARARGEKMLTVFANGACGNLNHRNVWWSDPQKGAAETARLGNILSGAVCAAWPRLAEVQTAPLRALHQIVELPLPAVNDAERAEAREMVRRVRGEKMKFLDQVKLFRVLDVQARAGKPWQVEVQVIALGSDVAFVSLPGEVFVELGLAIKAGSPFKHTFIAELANGSIGYIPNKTAYREGNYEVISARCAEGSGEMLVDAARRMLRELHGK